MVGGNVVHTFCGCLDGTGPQLPMDTTTTLSAAPINLKGAGSDIIFDDSDYSAHKAIKTDMALTGGNTIVRANGATYQVLYR